jgi:hypothetical protein
MLTCHLVDEVSDCVVDKVTFEFVPSGNGSGAIMSRRRENAMLYGR